MRKVGLSIAGLLLALVVVEGGLRLASCVAQHDRERPNVDSVSTILCIGDSWTEGIESNDPASESYPARLQELIDRNLGAGRYHVIKFVRPTGLAELAAALPRLMEEHRPEVVIMLGGGTNWPSEIKLGPSAVDDHIVSGVFGRLKVIRLLRLVLRGRPRSAAALTKQIKAIRAELLRQVERKEPGPFPPLPTRGCADPDMTLHELHELESKPLLHRYDRTLRLLHREPTCAATMIRLMECCLEDMDLRCVGKHSKKLRDRAPDAPQTHILQELPARVHNVLQLTAFKTRSPAYLCRALRLVQLGRIRDDLELCHVYPRLMRLEEHLPQCQFPKHAVNILRRAIPNFEQGEVLDTLDRLLFLQLQRILHTTRQYGAKLLLINYPKFGFELCRARTINVIARFAGLTSTPIIELKPLFDSSLNPDARQIFGSGHPNARGYRLIAEQVYMTLSSLGWLAR